MTRASGVCGRQSLHYFETLGEQSDHFNVREEMPYRRRTVRQSNFNRQSGAFTSIPQADVEPQVREIFTNLCEDADVGMTQEDMERLFAVWGLPYAEAKHVFAELRQQLSNPNIISFQEFYKLLEPVWRYTLDVMEGEAPLETVKGKLKSMKTMAEI